MQKYAHICFKPYCQLTASSDHPAQSDWPRLLWIRWKFVLPFATSSSRRSGETFADWSCSCTGCSRPWCQPRTDPSTWSWIWACSRRPPCCVCATRFLTARNIRPKICPSRWWCWTGIPSGRRPVRVRPSCLWSRTTLHSFDRSWTARWRKDRFDGVDSTRVVEQSDLTGPWKWRSCFMEIFRHNRHQYAILQNQWDCLFIQKRDKMSALSCAHLPHYKLLLLPIPKVVLIYYFFFFFIFFIFFFLKVGGI